MICIKLFLVVFGCLVGLNQAHKIVTNSSWGIDTAELITGIDSAELVSNPCQDVRIAGFICVDCSTLGFCSNVNGQWQTVAMTDCQAERGFYCSDEGTIGCTWQPKCQVPVRGKFHCQLPGIFPDPYDCRSYHECSEQNVDTPRQCTNGAAYSLLTHSCSLPRESEQCTEKQYSCSYVGQTGAWASNSSYYYICQKDKQGDQYIYYPLMMKCSNGFSFNGHSCVQDTKTMLIDTIPQMSQCSDGEVLPAETTNGFYVCNNGKLFYQNCPEGYSFDPAVAVCFQFSDLCQEGELYPAGTTNGFYICANDKLFYQNCGEGLYFDPNKKYCIKQKEEMCQKGMFYPAETKYGFYFCHDGTLIYQKCAAGYSFDVTRHLCIQENEKCEEFKLYPADTEYGYLLCHNGELTSHSCPEGSIFDGLNAVCKSLHI